MTVAQAAAAVFTGATDFTARAVKLGVQAQVFTLTNDAAHDYPLWNMMTGFNKDLATDVAIYQVHRAPLPPHPPSSSHSPPTLLLLLCMHDDTPSMNLP